MNLLREEEVITLIDMLQQQQQQLQRLEDLLQERAIAHPDPDATVRGDEEIGRG